MEEKQWWMEEIQRGTAKTKGHLGYPNYGYIILKKFPKIYTYVNMI